MKGCNMQDFKDKQKRKRTQEIIFSIPALFILGVITILMMIAVWNIYVKSKETQENLDRITSVYDELHTRELELGASVNGLETSFGVESEIRDKYGLAREGEEVVVIIDDQAVGVDKKDQEKKSFWQKIKSLF